MKIFIVGATGRTGQALTQLAVAKGHNVTAFGRRPPQRLLEGSYFVAGDPQQVAALTAAISGHDAVVSCLGLRSVDDAGLLARSAAAAISAMRSSNVQRYVVVSQGLLFPSVNPIVMLLRIFLRHHVADSRAMEAAVLNSAVDWTIVRPPRLTSGTGARGFRIVKDARPNGNWSMLYNDLGACLLDIIENQSHIREIVGVASA